MLALLLGLNPDCVGKNEESNFDETIAQLLTRANVTRLDTRDGEGSARFIARPVEKLLIENNVSPYDSFVKESLHAPRLVSDSLAQFEVELAGKTAQPPLQIFADYSTRYIYTYSCHVQRDSKPILPPPKIVKLRF